ncbi:MAG: chorismate synthase [Candidatus Shikimatogenerans sp. AspAUS03]|uniref:Chorismate synthase n=1 Tax=Candidatus Shikimatogenerans sp. AspAUS03 TaxID=3158563 RepID=A0AAU7QUW7_9FLAO
MSFNSFGDIVKLITFGESHGLAIGGIIDGLPSNQKIDFKIINKDINKRKTNKFNLLSTRKEKDKVIFLSGIYKKYTLGTPIGFIIINKNVKSNDYKNIKNIFRPSHADYTYYKKYKIRDYRGGGRSSARETLCRIIAGSLSKQILKNLNKNIKIFAYVSSVGNIKLLKSYQKINRHNIKNNLIKCPDINIAKKMINYIKKIKNTGNTIGGIITCVIKNLPVGLGDPIYKKLSSSLSEAMFSINAVKGFEYGSGFKSTLMTGFQHNDIFLKNYITKTNYSGGIQGGISNGMEVYFNIGFKPVSSIFKNQITRNLKNKYKEILIKGRHDTCVLSRAVSIVEAMSYLVIINKYIINRIYNL